MSMTDLICYLIAFVLLGLAAFLPSLPYRDRIAYAGLCAFTFAFFVHAAKAR